MGLMTTTSAGNRLGISRHGIIKMIAKGTLKAKKYGHYWLVDSDDLAVAKQRRRKRGKPTNTTTKLANDDEIYFEGEE